MEAVKSLAVVEQANLSAQNGVAQLNVVTLNGESALPQLIETLNKAGATILKIAPQEVTLEDVFVAKTGRTLAEDTAVKATTGRS